MGKMYTTFKDIRYKLSLIFGQNKLSILKFYMFLTSWFPLVDKRLVLHSATCVALPTLNSDCEAHRGRRVKRYRPD